METTFTEKFKSIRKGLLEFAVLHVISTGSVYAADILEHLSATEFATQEGTLYPLLSKMRRESLLEYEWQESEAGPPRKYYQLTVEGKKRFAETKVYWQKIITTLTHLEKPAYE